MPGREQGPLSTAVRDRDRNPRRAPGTETTVLLVDDDPDLRTLASRFLENAGIRVVAEASTGRTALATWRALRPRPDVVVLDQRLPCSRGTEIAAELGSSEPDVCTILFTATVDDHLRRQAARAGMCAVVDKQQLALLPQVVAEIHSTHQARLSMVDAIS